MDRFYNILKEKNIKLHSIACVSETIVQEAEKRLNIHFPKQYRSVLLQHGCISFNDCELYGLGVNEMSFLNVVARTEELSSSAFFPGGLVVIAYLFDTRYLLLDQNGLVHDWDFSNGDMSKVNDSIEDYLIGRVLSNPT